jgi:hypothetical protein
MKNIYQNYSKQVISEMREYFLELIADAKRNHREYKSLEREVFKMTARLLKSDPDADCLGTPTTDTLVYDWQKRRDLQ